jgi:aminoglycoside phosphotransferase (APT) family kinase protein
MTLSPACDTSATDLLARLDPALAPLPPSAWPDGRPGGLHDVQWSPGERCRLAFRVRTAGAGTTFVAVETTPAGCRVHDYRDDAGLPGLRSATEPAAAAERLAAVVGGAVRRCGVQPVRYRPGERCVLRYDVETEAGTTASFYAKILRPERLPPVATARRLLAAAPELAGSVPRLAAVWPEPSAVVEAAVEGPALSRVLEDPQAPTTRCARIGRDLGRVLARFHGVSGPGAGTWSPADQVSALRGSLSPVLCADAALGARIGAAVDLLAAVAPGPQRTVLSHGAFRTGQVVVTPDAGPVVLDADGAGRCDAGRDLGNAAAYLTWQALRHPLRRESLSAAGRGLLAGYLDHRGPVAATVDWWHAASLLQVAARRYRRLETGSWPVVPSLVDTAEDLLTGLLTPRTLTLEDSPATVLAHAPGRRSVARYTVHGPAGADVPVVGKRFTDARRARLLHEHLCLLHAGPFRHGRYVVPEPVALVPERHLVLYRPCGGDLLDRLRGDALADGVVGAARWLARLHTCDVLLPRATSQAREGAACETSAATLARAYPELAARARAFAHRWRAAAGGTQPWAAVPIHHDFHPGHVLVGARVCVIDLDEARQGDPAFDVAHFCAYLELGHPRTGAALTQRFCGAYAAADGPAVEDTYALFSACAWLKIAKQWAVGSGPGRDVSPALHRAGAASALTQAERWLCG